MRMQPPMSRTAHVEWQARICRHTLNTIAAATVGLALSVLPTVEVGLVLAGARTAQASDGLSARDAPPLKLWYRQPAEKWVEALPLGNGRLGAMVFGGVDQARLQFNEDTVWTGRPHEYQHEGASKYLAQIRKLLDEGKQREAETLAMREFMSVPLRQKAYQPFGDLQIHLPAETEVTDYRRELNLDTAITMVRYRRGDTKFVRRAFVSHPDQAIVWHIVADRPGQVAFTAELTSPHKSARTVVRDGIQLVLTGR